MRLQWAVPLIRLIVAFAARRHRVRRAVQSIGAAASAAAPGGFRERAANPTGTGSEGASRVLRVAAVQMELCLEPSVEAYVDHVHRLVREAVERGSELIVFPEDTPTGLIGLIPGVGRLVGGGGGSNPPGGSLSNPAAGGSSGRTGDPTHVAEQGRSDGSPSRPSNSRAPDVSTGAAPPEEPTAHLDTGGLPVAAIFRALTPALYRVYRECFATLAASYGVHIVAGSGMFALDGKHLTNTAHLFGPDGLIGTQDKLHFIPMEQEWGLDAGERLAVFDLPKARISVPVCMDATYYEVFRIAAAKGAEVIIIPTANPERYDSWRALRGIRTRIDENAAYGINSCMVGSLLGLPLEGRSAVLAPYDMCPSGDGILTEATDAVAEQIVTADLDLGKLDGYREASRSRCEPNRELYRRYYGKLYGPEFS